MTSGPAIERRVKGPFHRLNVFLDQYMLPYPIKFLTNRVIILATLGLLVPLIFFNSDQAFVNVLNSYLNVMSVVVSSTVLLYATIADVRDRAAAKQADEIAKAYEHLLEERVLGREEMAKAYEQKLEERVQGREQKLEQRIAGREEASKAYEQKLEQRIAGREEASKAYEQELEERVQGREQKLEQRIAGREEAAKAYEQELEQRVQGREQKLEQRIAGREEAAKAYEEELEQRVQADHEIIEQILQNSIENLLGERLEKIRIEDHKQLDEMQKAVLASNESLRAELAEKALLASNESLRAELAELREMVQALYQSHMGKSSDTSG